MAATDRMTCLQSINQKLEIRFDYDDDQKRMNPLEKGAVLGVGATAAGAGALYARGKLAAKAAPFLPGMAPAGASGIVSTIGAGAKAIPGDVTKGVGSAWAAIKNKLLKAAGTVGHAMSKHEKLIELNTRMDGFTEFMSPEKFQDRFGVSPAELYNKTRPEKNQDEAVGALKATGVIGAGALGYGTYKNRNRLAIGANLLKQPDVRRAISHDVRAGAASKLSKLAKYVKP